MANDGSCDICYDAGCLHGVVSGLDGTGNEAESKCDCNCHLSSDELKAIYGDIKYCEAMDK